MAGKQEIEFPSLPPGLRMRTTEGGQDNSVCEMHSRGLPVNAGKMSGAEWFGVIEHPSTPPDAFPQVWVARAGYAAGFLFILICKGLS